MLKIGDKMMEFSKLPPVSRIIFLFFPILLACNKTAQVDKGFALAYAELRITEQEYGESESGKIVRSQILQKHGLSAETFEKKIEDIKENAEIWLKFQKSVMEVLDSMNKALQPKPDSAAKQRRQKNDSIAKLRKPKLDSIAKSRRLKPDSIVKSRPKQE
jgi:hypothetical protein